MNYKKAYQKIKEQLKQEKGEEEKRYKIIKNMVFMTFITAIVFNLLDKLTPIPMGIEDGLSGDFYLLPMVFVGLFYLVYSFLWRAGKVKGRLMIF